MTDDVLPLLKARLAATRVVLDEIDRDQRRRLRIELGIESEAEARRAEVERLSRAIQRSLGGDSGQLAPCEESPDGQPIRLAHVPSAVWWGNSRGRADARNNSRGRAS